MIVLLSVCACVYMCVHVIVHVCICRSQRSTRDVVLQELSSMFFETGSFPGLVELSDSTKLACL